jgi:SAM-dependent methyltransferase
MQALRESYRLYQQLIVPGRHQIRRFIRACASRLFAGTCADVGAGTSPYRMELQRAGIVDYISFDIAPSDSTMVCADCCRLPLRDNSVDLVVAFDMITCIPDSQSMLAEAARVLAPGGHLMLTYAFVFGESGVHDFRRWTLEGMNRDLSASGFRVVAHEKRGGFFFALTKLCEAVVINCVPGNRASWRAGNSFYAFARVGITAALLLPFQGIGWIALLVDHVFPTSPIYFGGMVMAERLPERFLPSR